MPNVQTKIWQAMKARVASIPGYSADQIAWPMMPFEKPVVNGILVPYLAVEYLPNTISRIAIGDEVPQQRPGILQISLCWPVSDLGSEEGKTQPDVLVQMAGEIADYFPTGLCMSFQGVGVNVTKAPEVSSPYRDDAYVRISVSVYVRTFA